MALPIRGDQYMHLRRQNGLNTKQSLVLAALAVASSAWSQTRVDIYGTVDTFVQSARSGPNHLTRVEDGGSAASRIAFRGSEDLGGGLRAGFLLEAGFSPDTGLGTLPGPGIAFTRQSFVGLANSWGSVDLGRMYTPMFYTLVKADPFGVNALFSSLNLVTATDAQPGLRAFAARGSNMVRYRTPVTLPWFADLAYSFGEAASPNDSNGNLWGGTFGWNKKPFYIGYGFQKARAGFADAPVVAPNTSFYQTLSAAWDVTSFVRISGNFMRNKADTVGSPTARIWQLGAEWTVTPASRLLASVATRKVAGSSREQLTYTLGYDYSLSKRTMLYARWLGLQNRGASAVSLANIPVAANSGDNVGTLALGVRHDF